MSEVKVNKISPRTACGTVTLGDSGDTIAIGTGVTTSGMGRTGTVDWITTPKVTGDSPVTGVTGKGYFMNTTAGLITINLPAGVAGSIISVQDYALTFDTYALTVAPNGSEKINAGEAGESIRLETEGQGVTFVYVDSTVGWKSVQDNDFTIKGSSYIVATGGNSVTTCGNDKIHAFTAPGTFCVASLAPVAANNEVSYLVVAGGAGAGTCRSGGGGAGGFRENKSPITPYTASPLDGSTPITVTASPYSITVGGGGAGATSRSNNGATGSNSVFSSITSAGGGGGASDGAPGGVNGGSAGGAANSGTKGTGNTPPTSPPQGNDGGCSSNGDGGGGGGGAAAVGGDQCGTTAGVGGAGAGTLINPATGETGPGPSQYYGGGGGGGNTSSPGAKDGGIGGGGNGVGGEPSSPDTGGSGDANTGGGGGGNGGPTGDVAGGGGGSGIVIIRYRYQ
jgi:hypothetical protein